MNISEFAKAAGVSKAAVSRYFNGGYLSDEKKEAISKAIEKTGYVPSAQAQMLRTRKTRQIGVVLPKLSSESCSRMVEGISNVFIEQNYLLMLANTANDPEKEIEYLDLFRQHRVEGVIFIATIFTAEHHRILENMHIPVVILGQQYNDFDCVYHNDRGAAHELTALMLKKGRKRPGFIGVTLEDKAAGSERLKGFQDALGEFGIKQNAQNMRTAEFNMQSGYEKAAEILSQDNRPDCLLCATDNIAIGAMQYCRENGIIIPTDLMIAGIGDTNLGRVTNVTLTSAHLHYRTSGEEAANIMLSLLHKRGTGKRYLELGYEIIERDSTSDV